MSKILSLIFCSYHQAGIFNDDVKPILIIRWMEGTELEMELQMELLIFMDS